MYFVTELVFLVFYIFFNAITFYIFQIQLTSELYIMNGKTTSNIFLSKFFLFKSYQSITI